MNTTIDFGIDLGTTNSCVARWQQGGVRVFQNNDQMNVTPSAVYINRAGRKIVGMRAYSALQTDPANVATEFKRWMGQKDRRTFPAAKQSYSAEELSAEILKSLREDVRRQTGDEMTAAVITVPAAFGTPQCEATARAAQMAGILESPLLQEPIAAAIAYGASAQGAGQRWLVFDLGGGTLDIAVVSTRDGRLHVMEHRGNNLRGGKDIDQLIVDQVLWPALEAQFDLRSLLSGERSSPLRQQLRFEAERAKIALSTDTAVSIPLFDLGDDDAGKPIETEVDLSRAQLESLMDPMLEECISLAKSALSAARITGSDLHRILLVGGPTQAPVMRARLQQELGAPVDFSVDPMTVVAQGAALYALTLRRTELSALPGAPSRVPIQLAYEPVSAELTCQLAGRVTSASVDLEVKVEAEGGFWTSGWLALRGDQFETTVHLKQDSVTVFRISLRDRQGRLIETDSPEFKIRHGLAPSEPPLPHSISAEIVDSSGKEKLDLILPKGTLLPTERSIKYRAAHTLIPGKSDSDIYIKLWEGEFLDTPAANELIATLKLSNDGVKRKVPKGSEIEVRVSISNSRLITVEAYVPELHQEFSNIVYFPLRDAKSVCEEAAGIGEKIAEYSDELHELSECAPEDAAFRDLLQEVRSKLVDLEFKSTFRGNNNDPDDCKKIVVESRAVRGGILRLRYQMEQAPKPINIDWLLDVEYTKEVVEAHGDSEEKQTLSILREGLEGARSRGHDKLVPQILNEFMKLRYRVLFRQDSYWQNQFKALSRPGQAFIDGKEAQRLIEKGRVPAKNNIRDELKDVVRSLWRLLPGDEAIAVQKAGITGGSYVSRRVS